MDWFIAWWNALSTIQQILFCIAIPSTLILIIQMILLLVGFGSGETDFSDSTAAGDWDDFKGDSSSPGDFGVMSLFSIQGIVSFLCVFGWSGIAFIESRVPVFFSFAIAFVLGFGAMVGVAFIIRFSAKLVQNGTFNVKNLLGETATVYLAIPQKNSGKGKVTVQLSERFLEFEAITEEPLSLANNTSVRITDILSGNILVVEKIV